MAPQWATPERQRRLVQLAVAYKGRCLKGHRYCQDVGHYIHRYTKEETAGQNLVALEFPAEKERMDRRPEYLAAHRVVGTAHSVTVEHEELSDLYGVTEEKVIETWKADDREARSFERERVQQPAPTGEVGRFGVFHNPNRRSTYDPIDVDGYVNNRPKYYLMGYGVDGQMRRYAKVRIPGTTIILQVDVSQSIQELSQRKRKWLRRQGINPKTAEALCEDAVATWWAS